jgi:hypothetical protein
MPIAAQPHHKALLSEFPEDSTCCRPNTAREQKELEHQSCFSSQLKK